jgi:drug/metabolite transporter (DMT)-like permease
VGNDARAHRRRRGLRETSVLFAALIGALWLKEGFGWPRLAGAASVVVGVAAVEAVTKP